MADSHFEKKKHGNCMEKEIGMNFRKREKDRHQ